MNQTTLALHIFGLAFVLQLHMEIYVYKKKKARRCVCGMFEVTKNQEVR